jgi:hypothetical protein
MRYVNPLFDKIIAVLTTCNGVAIDDHAAHLPKLFDQLTIIKGIGTMKGCGTVVAVNPESTASTSYSLNALLYIADDGMVHVSRNQVGIVSAGNNLFDIVNDVTAIAK